jgi:hypothetical protein
MIVPRTLRLNDPTYNNLRPEADDQLVLDRPDLRGEVGELQFKEGGDITDTLRLVYLGGGEFKCAYRDPESQKVYIVVSDLKPDYNLACFEFIHRFTTSVHIPKVSLVGFTEKETIYQMEKYDPVILEKTLVQRDLLKGCWNQIRSGLESGGLDGVDWEFVYQGNKIRQKTLRCVESQYQVSSSLLRACNLIDEACSQIGDTQTLSFDFGDDNFAQDGKGRLILLDPLIDLEVLNFPEDYADIQGVSYWDSLFYLACYDGGRRE